MSRLQNQGSERYTVFPIRYPRLWSFYKKHEATFWTTEEIRLTDDLVHWNTHLNDNERYFVKNILAFFASSDGIVNENLVVNFYNEIQIPEARSFYTIQMMMETIHSETYSVLIDTYVVNTDEKLRLFAAMETIPAVKEKADWAIKWIEEGTGMQSSIPEGVMSALKSVDVGVLTKEQQGALHYITKERPGFLQRLLSFVCVEGIFFSGSFCAVYWLKSRGLMPGLCTANEFISRDENLHAEFAIELYKTFADERLSQSVVHAIFKEAVDIEIAFVTDSLPVSLIGMNCTLMSQYIQYVADRWLVLLDYDKMYNVSNPFPFMDLISVNTKENFFELNVSNYSKANVGTTAEDRELVFDSDDF